MLKSFAALGLLIILWGEARAGAGDFVGSDHRHALPAPLEESLDRVDTARLREHIAWLSATRREGRGLGTQGLEAAGDYIVERLSAAGLVPVRAGASGPRNSAFSQRVPLDEVHGHAGEVVIAVKGRPVRTAVAGVSAVLPRIAPQIIKGRVIYAGFGIREPTLDHDDYRKLDVRGCIVVFRSGVPPGLEWQSPAILERYANPRPEDRYDARIETLAKLGAAAAIAIEPDLPAELTAGKERLEEPYFVAAGDPSPIALPPLVRVTPEVFAGNLEPAALASGSTVSIRVTGRVVAAASRNIIAVLQGSDPRLRDEAVMIGAHMDHLGVQDGVLYPGADDNASGVSALLEIARSIGLSKVRPRRSVVFAFWTAEEAGQLGSSHYVRHPLWPLERTAAYLNLDMIGHPWSGEDIHRLVAKKDGDGASQLLARATPANFTEIGLPEATPELTEALATAAGGVGMLLHLDRTDGKNGGSDYRSFARRGLVFVRFFGNFFPGYHEPQDTPDELDTEQVRRIARLALASVWTFADR